MCHRSRKLNQKMDGPTAEALAANYLKTRGLQIVDNNYATRRGEIDLIAQTGDLLIFVEVRYRSHNHFGSPAESVDYYKQKRLLLAATRYLQQQNLTDKIQCRFDVVSISPNHTDCGYNSYDKKNHYRVEWLQNAFCA